MDKKLWIIVIAASLMQFAASFTVNLLVVALPYIGNDFAIPFTLQNDLNLIFMLAMTAFSFPISSYLNKKGIKKTAIIISILSTIFLIISLLAFNCDILIASRFLQGIAMGILYISGNLMISLAIPESKLGYSLGILFASGYVGITLAPCITGFLINFVGWRSIFLLPILILLFAIVLLFMVDFNYEVEKTPNDYGGSILWAISIFCLIYGLSNFNYSFLIVIGFILFVAFYFYEKRNINPLFNMNLFNNLNYTFANIAGMMMCVISHSIPLLISYLLTYIYHLNPVIVGLVLFIGPVCQVIIAPLSGKLADKMDSAYIMPIAFLIMIFVTGLLIFVNILPYQFLILALILQSVSYALNSPSNSKFIITLVDKKHIKDVISFLPNIKSVGNSLSIAIVNFVFFMIIGVSSVYENPIKLEYSIEVIFFIFLILSIVSFILTVYNAQLRKKVLN